MISWFGGLLYGESRGFVLDFGIARVQMLKLRCLKQTCRWAVFFTRVRKVWIWSQILMKILTDGDERKIVSDWKEKICDGRSEENKVHNFFFIYGIYGTRWYNTRTSPVRKFPFSSFGINQKSQFYLQCCAWLPNWRVIITLHDPLKKQFFKSIL